MKGAPPTLSIDVGGTQMRAALVSAHGTILAHRSEETQTQAGAADSLAALAGSLGDHGAASAVIGVAGRVDYRSGRLLDGPNLPGGWIGDFDARALSQRLGLPVSLANDADLAAVGEASFGAGRGYDDLVFITISTGVGAGVVLGGRLAHGASSLAEAGHTVIDWQAFFRGDPSTVEELAGGRPMAARARKAGLDIPDAEALSRLAGAGNQLAASIVEDGRKAAAIAVLNLVQSFSPQAVVVGGGVGLNTPGLIGFIEGFISQHQPGGLPAVKVVAAALGDSAGLAGGAAWNQRFDPVG